MLKKQKVFNCKKLIKKSIIKLFGLIGGRRETLWKSISGLCRTFNLLDSSDLFWKTGRAPGPGDSLMENLE